jgi:hypothetical protein
MSKVKLFSGDKSTLGRPYTLPVVGDVTFSDDDNSIEVDSDKVDLLLDKDFGIKLSPAKDEDFKTKKEISSEANVKMLKGLDESEINSLLTPYPEKIVRNLKSLDQKIDYLAKEMLK